MICYIKVQDWLMLQGSILLHITSAPISHKSTTIYKQKYNVVFSDLS